MTTKNKTSPDTSDREIIATRVFDAPRELVWKMWTDPKHIAHWWGPRGFTNAIHKMEVRPGGTWEFVMHGPDGTNYKNKIVYNEIVERERITYSHVSLPLFDATVTFADEGGKTLLTMRMVFESAKLRNDVAEKFGAVEGQNQTLQRLSERLADHAAASEDEFLISRVFDAPRELVYQAWTNPAHLSQWWGPTGFTNPVCDLDLRIGGTYRIVVRSTDGVDYPLKGRYVEIVKNERLVYTMDTSEHPAHWHEILRKNLLPGETMPVGDLLNTVTFEDSEGKTKLTIRVRFSAAAIREAMLKMGMNEGWSLSLDRLKALLLKS